MWMENYLQTTTFPRKRQQRRNPFIVDALAKLQGSDLPLTTRIRFQHFVELYEEDCYYTHLAEEMADWYSEEENE